MTDPLAAAQQLVKSAFPEAVAAFLGGSTARGEATAGSDLDLVVIRPEGFEVHRETVRFEGWPVELFVQTPSSTRAFFDWDRVHAVPSLISMCATGLTLCDADGTAAELRAEAARLLAAGPAPVPAETLETRRYLLTDLYDDLADERPREERAVIAAQVLERASELLLSSGGHWQGKGKWLPRMLRAAHPELGGRLLDSYLGLLAGGPAGPFAAAVAEVLAHCGGELREGYRRVADAKVLAGPPRPAGATERQAEPAELPAELVAGYLERLGTGHPGPPTVAALFALHRAHVERVPYETLDIHLDRPTTIDPADSARRIAAGRGGYCFHLNGAFAALLTSLGYDVRLHVGGVQSGPEDPAGADANHLALTVRCEGREFLVDVGLGDALHEPLPLREGTYRQAPLTFVLAASAAEPGGWRLANDPQGSFTGMDFREGPATGMADFRAQHQWLSTAPESPFVRVATVLRRDAEVVETLRGCVLVRVTAEGRTVTEYTDPDAWYALLTGPFGLALDGPLGLDGADRERLWARVHGAHLAWKEATGWTPPVS
ncbi:arylamine N-acetyltransferase [Kitasatospora sp. NPDC096147]|uniref:arylamine N-acetyltransferase n=1 Tax=Kitasatospora sp. NPDC096147 TaxID=3364093 RepID=UPI00381FCC5F